MTRMKYIVLDGPLESPIIFPNYLDHAGMANGRKVLGAGSVDITVINGTIVVACFGRSQSLNVNSRINDDAKLIALMITPPR